jgi:recombination protein RecA
MKFYIAAFWHLTPDSSIGEDKANMRVPAALLREQIQSVLGDRCESAFLNQPKPASEVLSSVAGGIPRGAITEIVGPASSGRTSLLYSLLGGMTSQQEFCALLDAGDAFDPESATAAGVQLSQLLWVRCGGNVEHALKAADLLAHGGGFGLIAIDLGDTRERALNRIPPVAWFRLRHGVENTRTALVVMARRILARSCSALKIELERRRTLWQGRQPGGLFDGFEVTVHGTEKHRTSDHAFSIRR